MAEFKLPDVGEGLTEADIVAWHVAEGDTVAVNDVLVEIETAKSVVELPSPFAGVVGALLVAEGETVEVGTPIVRIGAEAAQTPEAQPALDLSNPAASGGGEGESLVGRDKGVRGRRARRTTSSAPAPAATPAGVEETPARPAAPVRALAKPPVRKLAKDLGVDLRALAGSEPVTREQVRQAAEGGSDAREHREPVRGVRKAMSQAMVESAFTAPHVTEWVTVDVTATTALLERLRRHPDLREHRLSPLLVLARAVCLAVRRTPEVNSWWDQDAQEVLFRGYVNLGIAAATPRGLVVPNVKDADSLPLPALAAALNELADTARAGRTQPADMAGGTLTITNVGPFGVDGGTPIINPGESAILCLGAVKRKPWVVTAADGTESIEVRDVCTLALSFDHRHIDGEKGSRFLADVAAVMTDPGMGLVL